MLFGLRWRLCSGVSTFSKRKLYFSMRQSDEPIEVLGHGTSLWHMVTVSPRILMQLSIFDFIQRVSSTISEP
jgi:hypothetical protein